MMMEALSSQQKKAQSKKKAKASRRRQSSPPSDEGSLEGQEGEEDKVALSNDTTGAACADPGLPCPADTSPTSEASMAAQGGGDTTLHSFLEGEPVEGSTVLAAPKKLKV